LSGDDLERIAEARGQTAADVIGKLLRDAEHTLARGGQRIAPGRAAALRERAPLGLARATPGVWCKTSVT
jgi:hypothetical protein